MYFRHPLNNIVKARPGFGQMKFCRYSHTFHSRQFLLLKYNEWRETKSPLQHLTRSFAIGKSKENESKACKSPSRLDLMAPSFRSYSSFKSSSKNRKEAMPQKSLTLKRCRQPTNYMPTFQTRGQSEEKTEKKEERPAKKYKADFCRHICGPCSSNFTLEIKAFQPPSDRNVSKGIIEKLTDAEVKEICKSKCPCKDSHVPQAQHSFVKAKTKSTANDSSNFENPSTTTQSTATNRDLTGRAHLTSPSPISRQTNSIDNNAPLSGSSGTTNTTEPMRSSYKHKSKHARMKRYKQTRRVSKYRHHLRLIYRVDSHQRCHVTPRLENYIDPRQSYRIGPVSHELTRHQNSVSPPPSLHLQNRPNAYPYESFVKIGCHFEQLKPVPFRYVPLRPKNYNSDPVIKNRSPTFAPTYMRMPPINSLQSYALRSDQINSPAFGSERNRQMVNINPRMPKMINPAEFVALPANINNVTISNPIETVLPLLEMEKTEQKDIETLKESRKIMSKLVENLTVVVDAPGKLKLATSPYPKLRDEKDVIIKMEYVNLTDADARHYLTGKYNPHSYATTTVGRTGSGIIIETGQKVHDVKPGDKVFVKPVSCGTCSLCLSDQRNLCESVTASELSPMVGVLSRLHVHSSEFVTKIPENVSVLSGAMCWMLSAAIRACQKSSVSAGDAVLVIGGGALGMATSLAAQLLGATTVCFADIRKSILDDAEKVGIDKVFHIDPRSPSKNTAIKLWEQIGVYPRVTFDCTGSQLTNEIAINGTQTGGKVVVMTNSGVDIRLPISNLVTRNIDVIISTCGNDESDIAALRFLATNKILFESFIHKHYDLSNADEALEDLRDPNRVDSHVIIKCGCDCGKWSGSDDWADDKI